MYEGPQSKQESRAQKEGTGQSKTAVFKNTLYKEHIQCIRIELGTFVA